MSTSVVRCGAPWRIAARPPMRTYRTSCLVKTARISAGCSSGISTSGGSSRSSRFVHLEPGQQRVEALVRCPTSILLREGERVFVERNESHRQIEPARPNEPDDTVERRRHDPRLDPCDLGLTHPSPRRELSLAQARAPSRFEDELPTGHASHDTPLASFRCVMSIEMMRVAHQTLRYPELVGRRREHLGHLPDRYFELRRLS